MGLAVAIARLGRTGVQARNGAVDEAIALLTALRIRDGQVPVKRLALIANPARHSLLALAQLTHGHRPTASKLIDHTRRIAVAVLAGGEVVEGLLASLTLTTVKVGFAANEKGD